MTQAKCGDVVKVHYVAKLEDGTVCDSSLERKKPLQFMIGNKRVIPGLEEAVVGMEPGDTKKAQVSSGMAFGKRFDDLITEVSRDELPEGTELKVGERLQVFLEGGQLRTVTVVGIAGSSVTLDTNHPLAGEDLTIDIKLLEIA